MYDLVSRIPEGLTELKKVLEDHIYQQGSEALESCYQTAMNVCEIDSFLISNSELIFLQNFRILSST